MTESQTTTPDPLDHVPEDLRQVIARTVPTDSVQLSARYDLDEQGMYVDGWLVLTEDRLGRFLRQNEEWQGDWLPLEQIDSAAMVEGLGMGLIRLLRDGSIDAEYRFSMRHAKEVATLQRRMEKLISGKEEEEEPVDKKAKEEKKLRCDKCGRVIPPWSEVCPACLSRRKVLSRLLDFVKPYRRQAVAGFSLAAVATLSMLVRPYLTRPMLDDGLGVAQGKSPDYRLLLGYILFMAFLTILSAVTGSIRERLMATLGSHMGRDIRDQTYKHLHDLSLSFFSKKPTGSLVTRVTSDSDRIWDFVAFTLIELAIAILTVAGVGVALFVLNWRLACIVLLPVPVMFFMTIWFHKKLHSGFHRLHHRWSQMTAVAGRPPGRTCRCTRTSRRTGPGFRPLGASRWWT